MEPLGRDLDETLGSVLNHPGRFLVAPLEGQFFLDRTPREDSGWKQYIIEGFSVQPLIGDLLSNLLQMVLGISKSVGQWVWCRSSSSSYRHTAAARENETYHDEGH